MADGVPITAGTGTTIATDDTGATGHVQLVKLAYSADGSPTLITADVNGLKVNASGTAVPVTDNNGSLTVDGTVGATQSGTWTVQPGNTANTTAWKVDASSVAVPITDNNGSLTVDGTVSVNLATSTTATLTNVNDAATSATLLSANSARKGMAIYNDSTAILYVKYGTTASATSFTVRMDPYGYFESVGHGIYTGRVDGIWSFDASGAARVTEW